MSTRAAETLREELESRGPVRVVRGRGRAEGDAQDRAPPGRRRPDRARRRRRRRLRLSRASATCRAPCRPPADGGATPRDLHPLHSARGAELVRRLGARRPVGAPAPRRRRAAARAPTPPVDPAEQHGRSRCARRASRATRTATATAWSRSKASSRASPARRRRRSARCVRSVGEQLDALQQEMARRARRHRDARWRARSCAASCAARPECVAQVAERGARRAAAERAPHRRCASIPTTTRWSPTAPAEVLAARGARLVADAAIARGGCRVESDIGLVDASIDDALAPRRRGARQRRRLAGDAPTPRADAGARA